MGWDGVQDELLNVTVDHVDVDDWLLMAYDVTQLLSIVLVFLNQEQFWYNGILIDIRWDSLMLAGIWDGMRFRVSWDM